MKVLAILGLVGALLAGGVGGYALHRAKTLPADNPHKQVRTQAVLSQAAQRQFETIVIGDSMVEFADLREFCDAPALNAGVGGATLSELEPLLGELLKRQRPKRVIVAAGVNDARRNRPTIDEDFRRALASLLALARTSGAEVSVAAIAPVAKNGGMGEKYFDTRLIGRFNSIISQMGMPLPVTKLLAGADGYLPPNLSDDGAHLTGAGYELWKLAIAQACSPGR